MQYLNILLVIYSGFDKFNKLTNNKFTNNDLADIAITISTFALFAGIEK
jgi:hypothetical protein